MILDGGGGVDRVDFSDEGRGVTLDLSITDWQDLGPSIKRVIGFENVTGTRYDDRITGDAGANVINGGSGGLDILDGAGGADLIYGVGGDKVYGGAGDDVLVGGGVDLGDLHTTLSGDDGNDLLVSTAGDNWLFGGAGDDMMVFLTGAGYAEGGEGIDTLVVGPQAGATIIDLTGDQISERGVVVDDVRVIACNEGAERIVAAGSAFADHFIGMDRDDDLRGMAGADVLEGRGGDDRLSGGRATIS